MRGDGRNARHRLRDPAARRLPRAREARGTHDRRRPRRRRPVRGRGRRLPSARRGGLPRVALHRSGRNADPRRAGRGRARDRTAHGSLRRSARSRRTAARVRARGGGRELRHGPRPEGECGPRSALHERAADRRHRRHSRTQHRPRDRRACGVRGLGKRGARDEGDHGVVASRRAERVTAPRRARRVLCRARHDHPFITRNTWRFTASARTSSR
ncbi:hypothetical protein PT2222_40096 [Paraburkholderia tropica]